MAATPQHGKQGAVYRLRTTATASSLSSEACTESGTTAQITDAAKRLLDPNNPPVFTSTGGENVLSINYTTGTVYFDGNVDIDTVTVTGTDCYYAASELDKVGYVTDWTLNISVDLADSSYMGQAWKSFTAGQAGGSGSVGAFFIGDDSFLDGITNKEYFLLQLFTYDPSQDQTGDHFKAWSLFNSNGVSAAVGDTVKETMDFTVEGIPSFYEE